MELNLIDLAEESSDKEQSEERYSKRPYYKARSWNEEDNLQVSTLKAYFFKIFVEAKGALQISTVDGLCQIGHNCGVEQEPYDCNRRNGLIQPFLSRELIDFPFDQPE